MTAATAVEETCQVAEENAAQTDAEARFPKQALDAMRKNGLLGLMVPAQFGGGGGSLSEMADATIQLGRADMSVAMIFTMHCQQVVTLARFGGDQLRALILPQVAQGKIYLASVTTEAGSGGHLLTSSSPVHAREGTLWIDRMAPIVTGGMQADGFLITVLAPGATSPAQVDLVYVARDQLRLEARGDWQPLGMRATESLPLHLTGSVPEWQVIGDHGGFRAIAAQAFAPLAHIGWAAAWLGTAAGAYSRVVKHLRGSAAPRESSPVSELRLARLATTRARLDVVNALLRHTVSVVESRQDLSAPPVQLLINTLKTQAAEDCFAAVHELVELCGLRHGYLTQSALRLERAFRDLRSASLNYANDRLLLTNGALTLLDSAVRFA